MPMNNPEPNAFQRVKCRHCNCTISRLFTNQLKVSSVVADKHWVRLQSYWICPDCYSVNPVGKEVYVPNRSPEKRG